MILLDTSFIVSYNNERDENHERALRVMNDITSNKYGEAAITDYIFDESMTVLLVRLKELNRVVRIGEKLNELTMQTVGNAIFEIAWSLFRNQKTNKLSFTDCTTIACMQEMNIPLLATFDQEFKKIEGIAVID